ncbi:MAG: hypothetical protein ACREOZ_01845, partial [Gloeomargaritales cyanobacterium]
PPNPNTMATKGAQLNALRELRTIAACQASALGAQYDDLRHLMRNINDTNNQPLKHQQRQMKQQARNFTATIDDEDNRVNNYNPSASIYRHSVAEQVIQRYKEPSLASHESHPTSPDDGKPADFPQGYRGCLSCSHEDHIWRYCPQRDHPEDKIRETAWKRFRRTFNAHYPDRKITRNNPEPPRLTERSVQFHLDNNRTSRQGLGMRFAPSNNGLGRGRHTAQPAWQTQDSDTPHSPTPVLSPPPPTTDHQYGTSGIKKARILPQFVRCLQNNSTERRKMPVSINNGLPTICFDIGNKRDEISLSTLLDSCAALNTGYLLFHQFLITAYPSLVHSYEEFNDANPFDPVGLHGALDIAAKGSDAYGRLTAIVRYYTPYRDNNDAPVIIAFALGEDVSVNTIIGWPTIKTLQIDVLSSVNLAVSHQI